MTENRSQIPKDPTQRELWLMGFSLEQREQIIKICKEKGWNAIEMGKTLATVTRASRIAARQMSEYLHTKRYLRTPIMSIPPWRQR